MSSRFDLHTHTTYSDGSLSPRELLFLAKEKGLSGISITDHDAVLAYEEAVGAAKELGLWLGSGVELSCHFEGASVHLLGYGFDWKDGGVAALCHKHLERRRQRNEAILDRLKKRGMAIAAEELEGLPGSVGRVHIANLMVSKGYVKTIREAFRRFLADGASCFVAGTLFSPQEAMEAVRGAGGKVFLAHPHLLKGGFPLDRLLELKLDGLECYYGNLGNAEFWIKKARERGMLVSGGSDFHGVAKPDVELGASFVDEAVMHAIF